MIYVFQKNGNQAIQKVLRKHGVETKTVHVQNDKNNKAIIN